MGDQRPDLADGDDDGPRAFELGGVVDREFDGTALLGGGAGRDIHVGDLGDRPIFVGSPGLQQFLPVTNVRDYGALGNGTGDDTEAIQEALNRTGDGGIVYFPFGDYPVQGLYLLERKCLTLLGEGHCSMLRRTGTDDTTGILHAIGCQDLVIRRIGFDANGLEPRLLNTRETGLLSFQRCNGVDIVETTLGDSAPPGPLSFSGNPVTDEWRTGILFDYQDITVFNPVEFSEIKLPEADNPFLHIPDSTSRSTFTHTREPNRNVRLRRNRLSHLGILVRHASRVRIEENKFRSTSGYAIVVGGRGDRISSVDITVTGNEIFHPAVGGVAVVACSEVEHFVPRNDMISAIRMIRIKVLNNVIVKRSDVPSVTAGGHGILVGLAEEALPGPIDDPLEMTHPVSDITMRDIVVDSNHVEFAREESWPARDAFGITFSYKFVDLRWPLAHADDLEGRYWRGGLFAPAAEAPVENAPFLDQSVGFLHVAISRNLIIGARTSGIRAQRLCRSAVRDNMIEECTSGLHLDAPYFSFVTGNHAITTGNSPYKIATPAFTSVVGNVAAPTTVRRRGAYSDAELWPDAVWTAVESELMSVFGGRLKTHGGDQK